MTRKDFAAIAAAIKAGDGTEDFAARRAVALRLANYLATTNTRFDRERFLNASGVTL